MTHEYIMRSVLGFSIMLNLFYILSIVPDKNVMVRFYKRQMEIWREGYFNLLDHGEKITDIKEGVIQGQSTKNGSGQKDPA